MPCRPAGHLGARHGHGHGHGHEHGHEHGHRIEWHGVTLDLSGSVHLFSERCLVSWEVDVVEMRRWTWTVHCYCSGPLEDFVWNRLVVLYPCNKTHSDDGDYLPMAKNERKWRIWMAIKYQSDA